MDIESCQISEGLPLTLCVVLLFRYLVRVLLQERERTGPGKAAKWENTEHLLPSTSELGKELGAQGTVGV